MSGRPSRVVFVGNIPYDLTETQLIDIFKEVGPVVSFRLVFDRDTGKPKGYGFCTFQDAETAASAVRNLNNYDVGGRQLRIDFAESDKEDPGAGGGPPAGGARQQPVDDRKPPQAQAPIQPVVQPAPTMQQGPPPQPSTEAINKLLASYPPEQMLEVLAQMKVHIQSSPDQVRTLLTEQPQLSYALFQALLVMNVVEPAIMQRILQSQAGPLQMQQAPQVAPQQMPTSALNLAGGIPQLQAQQAQFQRQQTPQMPLAGMGGPVQMPGMPNLNPQLMTPDMLQEQQKVD
ncbi:hypothetical protein PhCBS80983_g00534 [Powellomyces hirtus]|uniref:RRM domain-containing protein n=1 Tax=Powellomyces hirtus TaxID=109895 RepID=A0A507EGC0_9FUNG|nr:hypothetical protein PhCBS80983_g00534 [Powellomyces hirtus]